MHEEKAKLVRKAFRFKVLCNECGKYFTKTITAGTLEIKCPKCGGYDTEPTD